MVITERYKTIQIKVEGKCLRILGKIIFKAYFKIVTAIIFICIGHSFGHTKDIY